jgi:hypothetical protein
MRRPVLLCTGFLTLAVLGLGWRGHRARADPAPDGCTTRCSERTNFIIGYAFGNDPTETCHRFMTAPDCAWCWQGRCVDNEATTDATCTKDPNNTQITIQKYEPGGCSALCKLNANSYSQATLSKDAKEAGVWYATYHYCPK